MHGAIGLNPDVRNSPGDPAPCRIHGGTRSSATCRVRSGGRLSPESRKPLPRLTCLCDESRLRTTLQRPSPGIPPDDTAPTPGRSSMPVVSPPKGLKARRVREVPEAEQDQVDPDSLGATRPTAYPRCNRSPSYRNCRPPTSSSLPPGRAATISPSAFLGVEPSVGNPLVNGPSGAASRTSAMCQQPTFRPCATPIDSAGPCR